MRPLDTVPRSPKIGPCRRTGARAACAALLALGGCKSATQHLVDVERGADAALHARRGAVPEVAGSLDVRAADRAAGPARALHAVTLDLDEALRLAAAASYEHREARERAYVAALDLVAQRQRFRTQGALGAAGALARDPDGTTIEGGADGALSRAFETGGSVVVRLATTFLKVLSSSPTEASASLLSADLLLPLVRGAGSVARESLTQAERDVLYALRAFARAQQRLVVTVATDYYAVLARRDVLDNENRTYESLVLVHERAKAFGAEGRMPDFEVDQASQDVLRAQDRRQQAEQALEASLDRFKRTLGLPVSTKVTLEATALETLREAGLSVEEPALEDALATGLARRLELATARDRADDARRRLAVAADALGAGLALRAEGAVDSPGRRPFDVRGARPRGSVGVELDLPIERTAEAAAHRAAELDVERARRDVERAEDDVTAEVRQALRALAQARRSFDIQREGVRLAERRVESAKLNLQYGKATIRDVLDAENSLVQARNALTSALVDHTVARLELERDTGGLDASVLGRPAVPAPPRPE